MKIGVEIIRTSAIEDVETAVRRLERAGLDSVWLADHLMGYYHPEIWAGLPGGQGVPASAPTGYVWDGDAWVDPFCAIATIGRQTWLPLGIAVTDGTRRRGGDLARTLLTLSQTTRGGFVLGLGAGEAMSLNPFGYGFDRPVAHMETTLLELRSLLDTGRMPTGTGRLGLEPNGPAGRPQVWVAANSARSLTLAGRYGDGWIHLGASSEIFAQQRELVRAAADAAGRPNPVSAVVLLAVIGESRAAIIDAIESAPEIKSIMLLTPAALWDAFGLQHPAGPNCRGLLDLLPHELDAETIRQVSPKIPMEMVEQFLVLGNASEIAERVRPLAEAGAQHAVFTDLTMAVFPPDQADDFQSRYGELAAILRSEPQR